MLACIIFFFPVYQQYQHPLFPQSEPCVIIKFHKLKQQNKQQTMKVIKRFFSNSIYLPPNELCEQYLAAVKLNTLEELPNQYQPLLTLSLSKCQKPHSFLAELIKAYKQLNNHTSVLKMLTLIHNFVIEREYCREDIQDLEDFDMHILCGKDEKQVWFVDFCRSYVTYLMKLPSLADVYMEIGKKQYGTPPALHLTHIFRITNTVRVLFPAVTSAINVIGRYQAKQHAAIKELFMLLSTQLVKLYSYIKFLCDQILRQYRVYNVKDLRCFIETLPEMELLCDKIEDLLVNKYLKGKKITSKIEFKEERVAEVLYYLDYENPGKIQAPKTSDRKTSNSIFS